MEPSAVIYVIDEVGKIFVDVGEGLTQFHHPTIVSCEPGRWPPGARSRKWALPHSADGKLQVFARSAADKLTAPS
jgi:hypothetical protein